MKNKKNLIVFRALPKNRDARTVRYLKTEGYEKVILNTWEDTGNENFYIHKLKLDKKKIFKNNFISVVLILFVFVFFVLYKK